MHGAFEHFRAFPVDAEQNKESAKTKITMPVLVLSGDIYTALGGDLPQDIMLSSMQALAQNGRGETVTLSGYWIPEERPDFAIDQLFKFFGNSTDEKLNVLRYNFNSIPIFITAYYQRNKKKKKLIVRYKQ